MTADSSGCVACLRECESVLGESDTDMLPAIRDHRRTAWATSLVIHGLVLLLIGGASWQIHQGQTHFSSVVVDTAGVDDRRSPLADANSSEVLPEVEVTLLSHSKLEQVVSNDSLGVDDLVLDQLAKARAAAQQETSEEQLRRLDAAAQRLSSLSTEQSVDDISKTLNRVLDIPQVAQQPANMDVPFDFQTAQIVDATEVRADGRIKYFARMEDASGKSQDVEVDAAMGRQLVETFALIKKYPLLESLYRKTVIGLLNKLMKEDQKATPKKSPMPR